MMTLLCCRTQPGFTALELLPVFSSRHLCRGLQLPESRHTAPCPWEDALQSSQRLSFLLLSKLPPSLQFSVSYLKSSLCSWGCTGVMRGGLMDLSPMGIGDKNKSAWNWALKRLKGAGSALTHKGLVQFLFTWWPGIISKFSFCSEVCSSRLFAPYSLMLQLPAFSFASIADCWVGLWTPSERGPGLKVLKSNGLLHSVALA